MHVGKYVILFYYEADLVVRLCNGTENVRRTRCCGGRNFFGRGCTVVNATVCAWFWDDLRHKDRERER